MPDKLNTPEPLISVLCFVYNTGFRMEETLNSIMNQQFKEFELLISDDGSSDESVEIVENWIKKNEVHFKFPVFFNKNKVNIGIPKSVNFLLSMSKAQYFALMADDIWEADFLSTLHPILQNSDDKVAFVYADTKIYDTVRQSYWENGINPLILLPQLIGGVETDVVLKPIGYKLYRFNSDYMYNAQFVFNPVVAFTVLVKKDIVLELGGYDEQYYFEDMPMWFKINRFYDCLYVDEKLGTYIRHKSNITGSPNFKFQASILNLLFSEIKRNKIDANEIRVKNRILIEWQKIVVARKQSEKKENKIFYKILKEVCVLYPRSMYGILKQIFK